MTIKELITVGINDGKDRNKLLNILTESIDCEDSKIKTFEKIYDEIYGNTLCDNFCIKLVENMSNDTEKGVKWTIDQTNDIARKIGISFGRNDDSYTEHEFWAAMHHEYYLHKESLEESGLSEPTIFGKFADDYLDSQKGILKATFFFVENQKDKW